MDIRCCKGKCVYLQVAFKNIHERDTGHGIVGLKDGAVSLVADVYVLKGEFREILYAYFFNFDGDVVIFLYFLRYIFAKPALDSVGLEDKRDADE